MAGEEEEERRVHIDSTTPNTRVRWAPSQEVRRSEKWVPVRVLRVRVYVE